jgi:chaperonin GroES
MAQKDLSVHPIGGKILVLPEKQEEKTKSGIYLPENASKEKPQRGKVVALGTGKLTPEGKEVPFHVKVGNKVVFKKYSPDSIEIEDEEYLIMDEDDILAVLN